VTVESEPEQGSIFRIFFPISPDEVPCQPVKSARPGMRKAGSTVLVVDDEAMVRKMAATMLARLGFRVLEASDGPDAIEAFRRHQDEISCVVCDLNMPLMDGWETIASLRKILPGVPVILSSGYDKEQVMVGEHAEWPQAFLGKPYRLQELREAIDQFLMDKNEGVTPDT
ncbi:MAG: response regulator, partial [Desulfatirhabdiaceae bacterium]